MLQYKFITATSHNAHFCGCYFLMSNQILRPDRECLLVLISHRLICVNLIRTVSRCYMQGQLLCTFSDIFFLIEYVELPDVCQG